LSPTELNDGHHVAGKRGFHIVGMRQRPHRHFAAAL
jgi:hypothetical protein